MKSGRPRPLRKAVTPNSLRYRMRCTGPALEADEPECGIALGNSDSKTEVVSMGLPFRHHRTDSAAHLNSHSNRPQAWVRSMEIGSLKTTMTPSPTIWISVP